MGHEGTPKIRRINTKIVLFYPRHGHREPQTCGDTSVWLLSASVSPANVTAEDISESF